MSSGEPPKIDVAALRRDYMQRGLDESDLAADPFAQFAAWFQDALNCPAIREPNAMVLATISPEGQPRARYVLLKGYGPEGFVFFTSYESDKARELAAQPRAALTFGWLELERQVRIEGTVTKTSRAAVEAYFKTRPRGSCLGAWASSQSAVIAGRSVIESRLAEAEARFPGEVPAPETWGGYSLAPEQIEFWQGRSSRLHDRLRYRRNDGAWIVERLSP
ncbi:MAG TPA: pyridoxamine 5'-phosphate oxidase [Candidatus Methylacidiphilales bacterium]|nr:pyridoxamine 5'-phosphate oxidase [Candidatus Methylacidiphilales bacterium]